MSQDSQCKKITKLEVFRQINPFWLKVAKLATLANVANLMKFFSQETFKQL